ncbi:hypothetical protein B4168_2600 [Anoxybacillus flavithermus]|nr:hypothetical protein B4168_2600 [Anoxybacillus flavithermus]
MFQQTKNPDDTTKEVYCDSIVNKYEFWRIKWWKWLSKFFKSWRFDLNNPRACYRQAFKEGWMENMIRETTL